MKLSIVMASCNQGKYVRETVTNAVERLGSSGEVIVIDDNSTDGSCIGLDQKTVRVFRSPKRLGCSGARRVGATFAQGDVIITSDPHCFYDVGALQSISAIAVEKRSIVQPRVLMEGKTLIRGGRLYLDSRGLSIRRRITPGTYPALLGSVYAFPRDIVDRLGGWPILPSPWGRWEQLITVLSYRLGIPIEVAYKYRVIHREYRPEQVYPYAFTRLDDARNSHFLHASCFPLSYAGYFKGLLDAYHYDSKHADRDIGSLNFAAVTSLLTDWAKITELEFLANVMNIESLRNHRTILEHQQPTRKYVNRPRRKWTCTAN